MTTEGTDKYDNMNLDEPKYLDLIYRQTYLIEVDEKPEAFKDNDDGRMITIKGAEAKLPTGIH